MACVMKIWRSYGIDSQDGSRIIHQRGGQLLLKAVDLKGPAMDGQGKALTEGWGVCYLYIHYKPEFGVGAPPRI